MRIASDGAAFFLAALLFCLPAPAAFAETPPATVAVSLKPTAVGRTTVAWSGANGLTVSVDGVPVVRGSGLLLVKKGRTGVLLDQKREMPRVVDWTTTADGGRVARVTLENDAAACVYDLSVGRSGDTDSVTVDLAYRLKRDVPAEIDYAAAYLSGPVLQGSVLSGPVGSPVALRVLPVSPPPHANTREQNQLCPPFDQATLATRLGPVTISFQGNAPLPILFDARSDAKADRSTDFPVYWLGIDSPPVTRADGERHARFRFSFGPRAAPFRTAEKAALELTRSPLRPDAYAPPNRSLVIPHPKSAAYPLAAPFRLYPKTKIVPCDSTAGTRRAVAVLRLAIKDQASFEPAVQLMAAPHAIFVGVAGQSPLLDRRDLGAAARAEGYSVRSSRDAVLVSGFDEAGVVSGAQATIHLLLATDRSGAFVRPAHIEDWPSPGTPAAAFSQGDAKRLREGYALRLAGAGVRPLADWLGYGAEDSPTGVSSGDSRFADGTIYDAGGGPLLLAGKLNLPGDYPMTAELSSLRGAEAKPRTVRLLVAASHEAMDGQRIGVVDVRTVDGKTVSVPLLYGKNIAAWSDGHDVAEAPVVWKGGTRFGQPFYLRRLEVNVDPGKVIDAVAVSSENTESAPALFGVTFLQ